jgi:hypothetical protein
MNEKFPETEAPNSSSVVQVPTDLCGCHPLISQTKQRLEKYKPDETLVLRSLKRGETITNQQPLCRNSLWTFKPVPRVCRLSGRRRLAPDGSLGYSAFPIVSIPSETATSAKNWLKLILNLT